MAPLDLTALYQQGLAAQQAGDTAAALALYDQILAVKSDIPEVLFQCARCLADRDPKQAEIAFRAALKLKPKEAAIWQGLHSVLRGGARVKLEKDAQRAKVPLGSELDARPIQQALAKGRADQAEAGAMALGKLAPAAFWPAYLLGEARLALSKPAVAPLEAATARDPNHAPARLALARAYAAAGRPIAAEAVLDDLTSPDSSLIRARLYRDTGRPEEAVATLDAHPPKPPRGPAELALSLAQTGQGDRALEAAKTAIAAGAPRVPLLRTLALACEEAGDISGAEAAMDHALSDPTADVLTHRAQLHQSAGDFSAADTALTAAIEANPMDGEAFRAYMNGRKLTPDDPLLPRLDAALARADLKPHDRAALHFAAAKARWDLKDHGAVFPHLDVANRLMAKAYPYSFEADLAEARTLTSEWKTLKDLPSDGPDDPVLFVTGLPRSGTTLIETILAAHAQVTAGGEMPFLGRALSPVLEALRHGTLTPDILSTAGARYLTAAQRRTGAPQVIADKAIATFSRIGHAARALPGARFILVKRDPRDTGLSLYRNMFPEGLHRYAYDLQAMGRYIRLHDAVTNFWKDALPERVQVVDYEALTADPEPQIRALLEAANLPWDPACLAPEASARRIQTLSFAQARQPIGTGAVAGWRRHEAELQPLIQALDTDVDLAP
ncbi:tetratricopeptide repeat-containing sulfotransferase family protein [Jannaschia sp. CCS1]|uniref:tetratricopeptide repeat-containing sulfotransferase family protein n=1 Tax=Jannaschia sp. (strain CCS1) TaxID=290400 RepID=UPI000053B9B0|nr:sulfotransferase [Jannaschia sp. CCS1]ABD56253.1 sulfotransferase [Jannaschia sp. CCS1]